MKKTRIIFALLLAISIVISTVGVTAFAGPIESPIIPIPGGDTSTPWYEYDFTDDQTSLILSGFNYQQNRTGITVRATAQKDGQTYPVVSVAPGVFRDSDGQKYIKSLEVEEGVQSIGENAFYGCTNLATVKIASSVTFIDETAFEGTAWLENQPDGLVYAGKIAYKVKGAAHESVVIADDTVAIAEGAFRGQTSLKKVFIPAATTVADDAFAGCTNLTIYCAENSPAYAYATANSIPVVAVPALVMNSVPTKTEYYQNDDLNLTGLDLVYISEAGETPVAVTPEMVSGYDATVLGNQTVTVTYEGKTVQFQVNVVERPAFIPGDVDNSGVVDLDDAIYLLYHVNFPANYLVNQPIDFDGSNEEDLDDAIYLLYHVNFPHSYPLH